MTRTRPPKSTTVRPAEKEPTLDGNHVYRLRAEAVMGKSKSKPARTGRPFQYDPVEEYALHLEKLHKLRQDELGVPERWGPWNKIYDAELHPAAALAFLARGASLAELSREFRVHPATLQNWRTRFPEFQEAVLVGEQAAMGWWSRQARENLCNPHFNARLWERVMINRYGWTGQLTNDRDPDPNPYFPGETGTPEGSLSPRELAELDPDLLEELMQVTERVMAVTALPV